MARRKKMHSLPLSAITSTGRGMLLLGIQFAMVASAMSRQLTPTLSAQELLQRAENTLWNRQLQAASEIVSRRRQRKRQRQLRQPENGVNQPHQRNLQSNMGNRYNDYLPEDAPDSLLALDVDPNTSTSTSTTCLSPLQKWFVSLIESIGAETWYEINSYNITTLAYLYKHHVSSADGTSEYYGTYGDRTDEMKGNQESLTTFWSTSSSQSNVLLLGMHGVDLAEDTKLVPTLQQMYSLDGSEAYAMAGRIQAIIETLPGAFNNPILTANAIAIQSLNPDGSTSERDSIIVGDGVFKFLEWLDLSNDGPDYIHSHEFGHHLQYDLGVDKIGNGWTNAEETRRWEMMADVFGSYFNAHERGGAMDASRLLEVHRSAFSLGDCEDELGSHHGLPRQRECASNFGANLALASYLDGGYIIPPVDLRRIFDEKYGDILALDDDQCEAVVDASLLDKAIYGGIIGSSAGSNSINKQPPLDSETPVSNVPVPAPSPPVDPDYEPYTEYFDASPQEGWNYGAPFDAYDPEEDSSPANELDKPPPRVQNGTFAEDEGWFGKTESQWVNGRTSWSTGNRSGIGTLLVAAALVQILLV
mmetsp:Transcript_31522/g.66302  ORF Transcript_31522/g.66302 Transcript_31522/m.66302 type:complete len:588 (+) Transcript_31522:105-1868(+)